MRSRPSQCRKVQSRRQANEAEEHGDPHRRIQHPSLHESLFCVHGRTVTVMFLAAGFSRIEFYLVTAPYHVCLNTASNRSRHIASTSLESALAATPGHNTLAPHEATCASGFRPHQPRHRPVWRLTLSTADADVDCSVGYSSRGQRALGRHAHTHAHVLHDLGTCTLQGLRKQLCLQPNPPGYAFSLLSASSLSSRSWRIV